jgi:hypothetical protein
LSEIKIKIQDTAKFVIVFLVFRIGLVTDLARPDNHFSGVGNKRTDITGDVAVFDGMVAFDLCAAFDLQLVILPEE